MRSTLIKTLVVSLALFGATAVIDAPTASAAPTCGVLADGAGQQANDAVMRACDQLGIPYVWGGGHAKQPGPSSGGLDCSGLVRYAYYLAVGEDIINGTSGSQYQTSRAVARFGRAEGTAPLLPGDLLFYGTSAPRIHHVAIYIGDGWMVEAPQTGQTVKVSAARVGGDYFGAVRLFEGGTTTPPAPGVNRIAFTEGGDLYALEGDPDETPIHQESDVKKFQMEGERIGVLTNEGALLVKEGDLDPGAVTVNPDSVTDFQLDGERIAFTEGETLYVAEGDLEAAPVQVASGVKNFQIEGDRIGVLTDKGEVLVKEGGVGADWYTVDEDSATSLQLHGNRIAYTEGESLYVKEDALDSEPVLQDEHVRSYQLSGDRIAVLNTEGALLVKEGDLGPGWETINTDSVTDFYLDTDRIAFTEGGSLYVKEGDLDSGLVHQADDVTAFQLDGERIAVQQGEELSVKQGGLGEDWYTVNPDSVTSFQIGADVNRPIK